MLLFLIKLIEFVFFLSKPVKIKNQLQKVSNPPIIFILIEINKYYLSVLH